LQTSLHFLGVNMFSTISSTSVSSVKCGANVPGFSISKCLSSNLSSNAVGGPAASVLVLTCPIWSSLENSRVQIVFGHDLLRLIRRTSALTLRIWRFASAFLRFFGFFISKTRTHPPRALLRFGYGLVFVSCCFAKPGLQHRRGRHVMPFSAGRCPACLLAMIFLLEAP
jgi:hypothetical protein